MEILKELQSTIGIVNDIRVANRGSPYFNHLTTVSEGIAMLGWVTIDPKPVDFVNETLSSAQFYGNRVLKEYKDKCVQLHRIKSCTDNQPGIIHMSNGFKASIVSSNLSSNISKTTTRQVSRGTTKTASIHRKLYAKYNQEKQGLWALLCRPQDPQHLLRLQ